MTSRKPGKTDRSRPRDDGEYAYKKAFYQSSEVASDYDFHRLGSSSRQRRHRSNWKVIRRALGLTQGVKTVLDLPCGTGRFSGLVGELGYKVLCSDISVEMMTVAQKAHEGDTAIAGFFRADAERLPFAHQSVDCVLSIRFLHHADSKDRVRILQEFARVSRRWVIVDLRHRYSYHWLRWRGKYLLRQIARMPPRMTRRQLFREATEAGLVIRNVFSVAPIFSDKWIVVLERKDS